MGDQNFFDDIEDFEKELVDIFIEDEPAPDHSLRCTDCKRVYKTRKGLERHTEICNKKKNPVDQQILVSLLTEALKKVSLDECCPLEMQEDVAKCFISNDHPLVSSKLVVELFSSLCSRLDIETFQTRQVPQFCPRSHSWSGNSHGFSTKLKVFKEIFKKSQGFAPTKLGRSAFYVEYMAQVVAKANIWLPDLKEATAVQLAMQYGDKMVHHAHTPAVSDDIVVCATSLTSKESHCITYIGGYVIRNLRQKLTHKKIEHTVKQQYSILLDACLRKLSKKSIFNQNDLVNTLTRGSLIEMTDILTRIFETVESYFRAHVSKQLEKEKKTNLGEHVFHLKNRMGIKGKFHVIIERCEQEVSGEIASNFLEDILKLYLKIRCFSHSKDLLQHIKAKQKLSRGKALRKGLKNNKVMQQLNKGANK
eukprot:gene3548-2035_t